MSNRLSSLRGQLREAHDRLAGLLEGCFGREPLLPGSLYSLRRKCGKPNCRCARGELHESTVLSYRGEARPQNISPPPEQIDGLRKMTDEYRRFRQARAQLVRWQRELIRLVDEIQAARVQRGAAEFQKLRSPAVQPRSSQR